MNPAATSPAARLLSEVTSAQPHLSVFLFPLSLGILYLGGWVFLVYFSIKKTKQNKKEVREKGLVCKVGFCFVNLLYIVFICRYFFFKKKIMMFVIHVQLYFIKKRVSAKVCLCQAASRLWSGMTTYSTGISAYLCVRLVDCKCCVLGVFLFVCFVL